jgi:hypothetical protein
VNAKIMSIALRAFVDDVDPTHERIFILVVDRAGFHTSKDLVLPENMILRFLPSHTPELQPVEPTWSIVREATHNRVFQNLSELEQRIIHRCQFLIAHPEEVKRKAGFAWACYEP